MIQSCQCNCCTTRNRMSTADIIFKLDGVAAYNKAEPSGGDLERLHQHNLKLQSELDKANEENTKLYAAHTELSRVDKRNFGELIIENVRLREANQALGAQVAELKIISSRNADNWIKHLNISTKQSEAIKVLRDALNSLGKYRSLNGDERVSSKCFEALSKVEALLGKGE